MKTEAESILGFQVSRLSSDQIERKLGQWMAEAGPPRYIACANPHSLMVADSNPAFRAALMEADLLVPDGVGIVLASKLLRGHVGARITGTDVFEASCRALQKVPDPRVFLLGSHPRTLRLFGERIERNFPPLRIAGHYSPPFVDAFTEAHMNEMIDAVNACRPHVLLVGMTAPKQEVWIWHARSRLMVPVTLAIGAVFDFYGGTKARPGQVFQRYGLEWLPRLLFEPRRLWRRTLVSAPKFLWKVAMTSVPKRSQKG